MTWLKSPRHLPESVAKYEIQDAFYGCAARNILLSLRLHQKPSMPIFNMICSNCGLRAHHIMSSEYGEYCENCSDLPVTSKNSTDGILTRTSYRVRRQQSRHEGDIVRPHVYDKSAKRERVNPDFLKLYPDKVKEFFTPAELKRDGYRDMPAKIAANKKRDAKARAKFKRDTVYSGSSKKAITNFLENTGGVPK